MAMAARKSGIRSNNGNWHALSHGCGNRQKRLARGRKLLVVQTLNKDLEPTGKPMGRLIRWAPELVSWFSGVAERKRAFPSKGEDTPTDCTIIGIVASGGGHVTQGSRT